MLTVRSLYILRNQTTTIYCVRVFYLDLLTDKVVRLADRKLNPNESMPLPDHPN